MIKKNIRNIIFIGFVAFIGIIALSFLNGNEAASFPEPEEEEVADPVLEYGFVIDSFNIHRDKIKPNQFLADILLKYHVPYPEIDLVVKSAKGIFDVRSIKTGKNYAVICGKDSIGKARAFVYEPSPFEYVVFDMRDSFRVYREEREVEYREKAASGIIHSSLYLTFKENDIDPVLAMKMSDIFAWTIDFYRIQAEDKFKVIYEEKLVDGEPIGIGRIKAALFEHWGEEYYAFYFQQEEKDDYFDENAKSLRKAFLQAPLKFSRISSGFTMKRFHPVQKRWKAHLGTDYAAPQGTPIMTIGDGVILEASSSKFNGKYVKVKHNSTYTTQYLHMSKIAPGMKPGKKVRQGDVIGYVGSTGLATGPHVCFRFWKNGKQVDHRKEKFPPSLPVNKENLPAFQQMMDSLRIRLNKIPYDEVPV